MWGEVGNLQALLLASCASLLSFFFSSTNIESEIENGYFVVLNVVQIAVKDIMFAMWFSCPPTSLTTLLGLPLSTLLSCTFA